MKIKFRSSLAIFLCFILYNCITQKEATNSINNSKIYILKHSIYNVDDEITRVYSDKIIYSKECITDPWKDNYPIPKSAIFFGAKVKIISASNRGEFVEVICSSNYDDGIKSTILKAPVLLKRYRKGGITGPFNFLFSSDPNYKETKLHSYDYSPRTKEDLIKYFGFPISICNAKDETIFYYNKDFLGFEVGGYHDVWYRIDKNGRIIEEWGIF